MMATCFSLLLLTLAVYPAPGAIAQDSSPDLSALQLDLEPVAEGLSQPVFMVDPDDGTGRFFVVEQSGAVRVLQDGNLLEAPLLDISGQISTSSEQGLLSIALHPDFADNGQLFISYTDVNGNSAIERWTLSEDDPNIADPSSAELILAVEQPAPNHNGGLIMFGPDGYLYIGFGDGGGQGDPNGNGQNLETILGKILRIDVDSTTGDLAYGIPEDNPFIDTDGARGEIWALGFRNPWRFSFDRESGDLLIGDVGQGDIEEANLIPADQGGLNFAWNSKEGPNCYAVSPCEDEAFVEPFFWYDHGVGGCSIVGGYVYRGEAIADLVGTYITGDYCTGQVWAVDPATGDFAEPIESGLNISSFAEDAGGEVYLIDLNGGIYRITG
jgi:glucose/arabinose dehydrogenase